MSNWYWFWIDWIAGALFCGAAQFVIQAVTS